MVKMLLRFIVHSYYFVIYNIPSHVFTVYRHNRALKTKKNKIVYLTSSTC